MIQQIGGNPIELWEKWLDKELQNPCENLKKYPDVATAMKAFRHLIKQTIVQNDIETFLKDTKG